MDLSKKNSLKDTGLLPSDTIVRLLKKGINSPAHLYYWIQENPEGTAELLGLSKGDTIALGTFLLRDWIDVKFFKIWISSSLDNADKPLNVLFKKTKNFI